MKRDFIYNNADSDFINFKRLIAAIRYIGKKCNIRSLKSTMAAFGTDNRTIFRWAKNKNSPSIKEFKLFCDKLRLNAINFIYNKNSFNPATDFIDSFDSDAEKDTGAQLYFLKTIVLLQNSLLQNYPKNLINIHILDRYYAIVSFRLFSKNNSPCIYFHIAQCRSNGLLKTYFDRGFWNDNSKLVKYDLSLFSVTESSLLNSYLNAIYVDTIKYSNTI